MLDFTADQAKELLNLGVKPATLQRLKDALPKLQRALRHAPAHNDVRSILREVAKHARVLEKSLTSISRQASRSQTLALALIEQAFWRKLQFEKGGTIFGVLGTPLLALAESAEEGVATLPSKPVRHKTADPKNVAIVTAALLGNRPVIVPSLSEDKPFRRVVCIFFEAAGASREPRRALEAYVKQYVQKKAGLMKAMSEAKDTELAD